MKDYRMSESGMRKLTELAGSRGADDKLRVIESAIDRMYEQVSIWDMLKDLQKQERLAHPIGTASWVILFYPNPHPKLSWWCGPWVADSKQSIFGDGRRKAYCAETPYDCVCDAWKTEKEARSVSDG